MTRKKATELLNNHAIEATPARTEVLYYLLRNNDRLVSISEIQQVCTKNFGRITIYRTLTTFSKAGLIYKIPDKHNKPFYAVVKRQLPLSNTVTLKNNECYHFQCLSCKTITWLPVSAGNIELPAGFVKTGSHLLFTGYCSKCSQKGKGLVRKQ